MKEASSNANPISIRELIQKVIARKKWQSRLDLHQLFDFWDEIVGEDISERAQPARIRGTVLWVDVTDSIWMQQLHFQKILLLDLINQKLGGTGISDLRFQLNVNVRKEEEKLHQATPSLPVDKKKMALFEEQLTPIANEEIKESLRNLWKKSQQSP